MKKLLFLCALFISSCLSLPFIMTPASAVTTTAHTVPTRTDFEIAIRNIESIDHYSDYYALSPTTLASTTEFYKEYQYLFRLVADLRHVISIYDTMRTEDLIALQKTANDAVIACKLKFGITKREYEASHPSLPNNTDKNTTTNTTTRPSAPQTPSSKPNPTVSTSNSDPQTSPKNPTTPATLTNASNTTPTSSPSSNSALDSKTNEPTTITQTPENPKNQNTTKTNPASSPESTPEAIDIPLTNHTPETSTSSLLTSLLPQILIISVALALIIVLVITNRRRPYRPGRRF